MAKLNKEDFISALKEMTILEVKELVDAMKEEFGVDPMAVAVAAAPAHRSPAPEFGSGSGAAPPGSAAPWCGKPWCPAPLPPPLHGAASGHPPPAAQAAPAADVPPGNCRNCRGTAPPDGG